MACRPIAAWTQAGEPSRIWSCDTPWDWAKLLTELAQDDEKELAVRMLAGAFAKLPRAEQPAAVQRWTQENITYKSDTPPQGIRGMLHGLRIAWKGEPFERFQAPGRTLARGAGDCDDSARLVRATLRALGWPARLVFIGTREYPGHVLAALPISETVELEVVPTVPLIGQWYWLDASLPARPGEHPSEAMRRTKWKAP